MDAGMSRRAPFRGTLAEMMFEGRTPSVDPATPFSGFVRSLLARVSPTSQAPLLRGTSRVADLCPVLESLGIEVSTKTNIASTDKAER